jgi:DNA-binding HxlR family transcriptional regulator
MYEKKLPIVLDNGLGLFLKVMSGKWKILLLAHIYTGSRHPGELQRKIPDGDRRVLNIQLKELVQHGIIAKTEKAGFPLSVEYTITPLGETLLDIVCQMHRWGEAHRHEIFGSEEFSGKRIDAKFNVVNGADTENTDCDFPVS